MEEQIYKISYGEHESALRRIAGIMDDLILCHKSGEVIGLFKCIKALYREIDAKLNKIEVEDYNAKIKEINVFVSNASMYNGNPNTNHKLNLKVEELELHVRRLANLHGFSTQNENKKGSIKKSL